VGEDGRCSVTASLQHVLRLQKVQAAILQLLPAHGSMRLHSLLRRKDDAMLS
jgi:hypothetical protein